MTPLQDLLQTDYPVIQAPMAGVQAGALALAVSNAGGLGSLPCALLTADALTQELRLIAASTSRPYNVNFFCHAEPQRNSDVDAAWRKRLQPYYEELQVDMAGVVRGPARAPFNADSIEIMDEFRPPIVSFHFGLPSAQLLQKVRSWGAKILATATTVAEAEWLAVRGVDAIIAQGIEAGGHRGMFLSNRVETQVGTLALVPQIVRSVECPVIAAGGIACPSGVRAALALGAAGVQLGTTYLLCPEATTSSIHRKALTSSRVETALTNVFTGRPARGIVNRLMHELNYITEMAPEFPLAAEAVQPLRIKAEHDGSGHFSPLWCGQNVSGCADIPAGELTKTLAAACGWV